MTNTQIEMVAKGTTITHAYNGRIEMITVAEVTGRGRCNNSRSRSHGHAYVMVYDTHDISHAIESDEYTQGQGYRTHDADGNRVSGYELVTQA